MRRWLSELGLRQWIYISAIGYHTSLGVLLLIHPSVIEINALYGLTEATGTSDARALGVMLLVASALAVGAVVYEQSGWKFGILVSLQQIILLCCMAGAAYLIWWKTYTPVDFIAALHSVGIHDARARHIIGLIPPNVIHKSTDPAALLGSQLILFATGLCHTGAIATRSRWPWTTG